MILLSEHNEEVSTVDHLNEQIINEVYFGDSVMSPILQQFSKFRSKWVKKDFDQKINYDPDLLKFNRMIEDQFGYYRFCLTIDPSYASNAFVYPIDIFSSKDAIKGYVSNLKVYKSNKGFKYDKDAHVSAVGSMYYGMIYNEDYSDRELIGVLLHEIGHTFFTTVTAQGNISGRKANAFTSIALSISNLIKSKKNITPEEASQDIEKLGIMFKIKSFFSNKNVIKNMFHSIANTASGMKRNMRHYDYTNEKFADTFASMYGYGSDVQNALQKMMQSQVNFYLPKKAPGAIMCAIKVGLLSLNGWYAYIINYQDPHPEGLTRIKTQIDYLERELRNSSLDPIMKRELQNQLEVQKQLIKDFIEYSSDEDGYKAYRIYYTKLYEKYGGDIREKDTDNEALFAHIDKRVDDLLKQEAAVEDDDELEDEDRTAVNERNKRKDNNLLLLKKENNE